MESLLLLCVAVLLTVVLLQARKLTKVEHARRKHTRLPR
jgi:hypothetical protein